MSVAVQIHHVDSIRFTRETLWVDYHDQGPERAKPCEVLKIMWTIEPSLFESSSGSGAREGEITVYSGRSNEIDIGKVVDNRTYTNPELEDEEADEPCDSNEDSRLEQAGDGNYNC